MLPFGRRGEGALCVRSRGERTAAGRPASFFSSCWFSITGAALLGALCALGPAFASSPQAPDAQQLFQEAFQAQQRGDATVAVRKYQELIRLHPDMTAARANLGVVLVSLGRFDEAIAQYRAALQQVPDNRDLRLNLALAYYKKGDFAAAAEEFSPLHEQEPGDVRLVALLGDCYMRLGRYAQIITLVTPLEGAHPDDLALAWLLGYALIRTGQTQEGLKRVEKVLQQGQSAEAFMLAAEGHLKLENFEEARRDVDAAMRLNPHLPGLYTVRGMVLEYGGDDKGAEDAFQRALEANPNDFEAQMRLGSVLYAERKLDEARAHLNRALEIDPASPYPRYELARVERAQGQVEAAVKDLERVVRTEPEWLAPHVDLAALYFRLNRPQDGAREKAIVDRLSEEQRQREAKSHIITPALPVR
jgi:tetratricopeptide (TPR) repeat protein